MNIKIDIDIDTDTDTDTDTDHNNLDLSRQNVPKYATPKENPIVIGSTTSVLILFIIDLVVLIYLAFYRRSSCARSCIFIVILILFIIVDQSMHNYLQLLALKIYMFRFVLSSFYTTLKINYTYRRMLNIRKTPKTRFEQPQSQSSTQYPQKKEDQPQHPNNLKADLQKIPAPPPQSFLSNTKMTRQSHSVYKKLRNIDKANDLYHLFRKYRQKIRLDQMVYIFEKLVKVKNRHEDNQQLKGESWEEMEERRKVNQDKFNFIVQAIQLQMFKRAQTPETYIRFITSCSRIKTQQQLQKCYPIILKILKQELSPSPSSSPSPQQPSSPPPPSLNQLISMQTNITLLQSLLRILNNNHISIQQQDLNMILSFLKSTVNYIHLPTTTQHLDNVSFWELLQGYYKLYPKFKLGSVLLKGLVKDAVKRVKVEGVYRKVRDMRVGIRVEVGEEDRGFLERNMVSCLKKLFILQKLVLQQTKQSSLRKQIMQTKQNNLMYNSFYLIQYKLHKHIKQLLPKCKFISFPHHEQPQRQPIQKSGQTPKQQQQMLLEDDDQLYVGEQKQRIIWNHIEIIPMLITHLNNIFSHLQIEVLAKCDLLNLRNQQYQAVVIYLKKLFEFLPYFVQQSTKFTHPQIVNYTRLLHNSCTLLYSIISSPIYNLIPSSLSTKFLSPLFSTLIKNFPSLPPQVQSIVMWHSLRGQKNSSQLMSKLIDYLIAPEPIQNSNSKSNSNSNSNKDNKQNDNTNYWNRQHKNNVWYTFLLVGNESYEKMLDGKQYREMEVAKNGFKSVLQNLEECLAIFKTNPKEVGQKMGKKLSNSVNKKQDYQRLVKQYQRLSLKNSGLAQSQILMIQRQKKEGQKKQRDGKMGRSMQKLYKQIEERIKRSLNLGITMVQVTKQIWNNKQGRECNSDKQQIIKKWSQQLNMLIVLPKNITKQQRQRIKQIQKQYNIMLIKQHNQNQQKQTQTQTQTQTQNNNNNNNHSDSNNNNNNNQQFKLSNKNMQ